VNTIFRLLVLVPSVLLFGYFAWGTFQDAGPHPLILLWAGIALIAALLIVWTIRDDRKRRALRSAIELKQ
jgi:hypothetical protein